MDYAKESLRLHGEWKGKIEVVTRVPVENKDDLSLAYTPVSYTHLDVYKRQVMDKEKREVGRRYEETKTELSFS